MLSSCIYGLSVSYYLTLHFAFPPSSPPVLPPVQRPGPAHGPGDLQSPAVLDAACWLYIHILFALRIMVSRIHPRALTLPVILMAHPVENLHHALLLPVC